MELTPPTSVDWMSRVSSYPMYFNDQIKSCTCAVAAHMIQQWTSQKSTEVVTAPDDVLSLYSTVSGYNPNTGYGDCGSSTEGLMQHWRISGLGGHHALAAAKVDHRDQDACKLALATFGGLYVGIALPSTARPNKVWDVVDGSHLMLGRHSINVGGYDGDTWHLSTFGRRCQMTKAFWDMYVLEAWVVASADWSTDPALGQTWTALTGRPSPYQP